MSSTRPSLPARRRLLAGLGTAGAVAAGTTLAPVVRPDPATAPDAPASREPRDGYRATPHVLRYYRTARV